MRKITDYKLLSSLIMKYYKRGVITNIFLSADTLKCEMSENRVYYTESEDLLCIYLKRDDHYRLFFSALSDSAVIPDEGKIVCDFSGDDKGILKRNGYLPYLTRVRLKYEGQGTGTAESEIANASDSLGIFELFQTEFDRYSGYIPTLSEIMNNTKIYIKREKNEIVAAMSVAEGKTCEIKHLCVKEGSRGQGYALGLVGDFLKGCKKCTVWTAGSNAAALKLYEGLGFVKDGAKSVVYMKG